MWGGGGHVCYDFSYSLALLRALGVPAWVPCHCYSTKKWRKKGNQGVYYPLAPRKAFCFLRLPLVVAARRERQKERRCLSPMFSLKSGTKGEIQEGTSWRVSSAASWGVPRRGRENRNSSACDAVTQYERQKEKQFEKSKTSPTASPCCARSVCGFVCLFFALPQRIGEEKAPRRSPWEPPASRRLFESRRVFSFFRKSSLLGA